MNSISELVKRKKELQEELQKIDEQVKIMNSETHKELLTKYVGKCYRGIHEENRSSCKRITRVSDVEKNHVVVEQFYIDVYAHKEINFNFGIGEIDNISFTDYYEEISVKEYNKQFTKFLKRIKGRK